MDSLDAARVAVLIPVALIASTIAAVAGTGGGVLLLPVMVALYGVRDAVPMYAVAQAVGNASRVWLNRGLIEWRVVGWFVLGAVPMAVLGAVAFARSPEGVLMRLLGGFLIASVVGRRSVMRRRDGFSPRWFTPIGGTFSFVSALVGSAGPFLAPFFLAFGLVKGAYIGTEATGTLVMHVVKLATYERTGVLSWTALACGLALGPVMIVGSMIGKRIVERLSPRVFIAVVEAAVVAFGLLFLVRG